ncbi:MAG TPA: SDR family NAD(P)-dependent oxidoreductase [Candidatus Angelobacter sp.]|nr:SDR family NAD(P)-dependent oxidoreductase [Candidatus Angelobacter sp.]
MDAIAIVGMACRYAEACSPRQLWENVLAQRRSFRRLPRVRLNLDDYSADAQSEDLIAPIMAAVLDDYEFDCSRFHISRDAFLSTDLSHWLALDVAEQALTDAKLLDASTEQRERTAVYVGNSLTGEFSRANLLRLRWPYVRRVLSAALNEREFLPSSKIEELIAQIEARYKAPFPATNEESLAGGLSNTIAGRICNYFDFKGGGYTVDGACASSLLAIATACSALKSGDVDIAIAGGVDLSLDPFELAGFSRLGALATEKMRVFDAHSSGFWPGEGCGMVVLMRHEDALAQQHTPYALIRGWGVSSDGQGGLTRPEVNGQRLALRRAYERSGYGIDSVAYFEGHGTGTTIGDATELQALSRARREASAQNNRAAVGSIKANIGHAKAAAGVAGLIKAAMAVHAKVLPPTTGCDQPHSELTTGKPALRVLHEAEVWPADFPVRAGVSGFGFGGINVHVTLEATDTLQRRSFTSIEQAQISAVQDCELFVFVANSVQELSSRLEETLRLAEEVSYSELADLSISLARQASEHTADRAVRAACIASSPDELAEAVRGLIACAAQPKQTIDVDQGTFFATAAKALRIGFLFPGQASPVYINGGIWSRRFPGLSGLYARAKLPQQQSNNTEVAQPCIVAASLAGLHVLAQFNIQASVAVGHSLGEITALYWAGACKEEDSFSLVRARGHAMAEAGDPNGAMASIRASYSEVLKRLNGDGLVVAARNAPQQTVVSGAAAAVRRFTQRLNFDGVTATMLPVSHAFHSPLVAEVAGAFSQHLATCTFSSLQRQVVSTVTGAVLDPETDLQTLLSEQITQPVLFADAFDIASAEADLFIEVGPGTVLSSITGEYTNKPVISLDAGSESLRGLFSALGAAFVLGVPVRLNPLFEKRFGRPIDINKRHSFLANPCETAPTCAPVKPNAAIVAHVPAALALEAGTEKPALDILMGLVAQRTQLPAMTINPAQRFLTDLHLNSITISQIMLETASLLSLPSPVAPAEYTNSTIAEAANALEALRSQAPQRSPEQYPAGVDSWVRVLGIELQEKPLCIATKHSPGQWRVAAIGESALSSQLHKEFSSVPGNGLVCCVPQELNERTAEFLLQSAQTAVEQHIPQIVFVQHRGGAAALARTLYLENPNLKITVVDSPIEHPDVATWTAAEASANTGFVEAHYDSAGIRREPRLKVLWPENDGNSSLESNDLLLVTGGGKGIAAESALHLARTSGCRLALLGRSDPSIDNELQSNLNRIKDAGITCAYLRADITEPSAVKAAIGNIELQFGPITAVLHGAGVNDPKRLEKITIRDLQQTLAPKIGGLRNVLNSIDPAKLRLLLTFGSIIARTGLHGEAHYGLANEFLNLMVERWQKEHAHCRCLNLEWSVWGGIGMGQRLGVLDSLVRQGITPIPLDDALEHLETMLNWKSAPASMIVTGRFGSLPTLKFHKPELPLLRFLENTRVHHPGIELITEAELSADSDPYVAEHAFQGEQLLPAVMGMEAMAQVAQVLEQSELLPVFRNLRFEHPIVIPRDQPLILRIAALRRKPGIVSAVIRCSSTGFKINHFSGECVFEKRQIAGDSSALPQRTQAPAVLNAKNLYGKILFHQGRFRRVEGYEFLHACESVAKLFAPSDAPWFARHLPPELVLGDPASRDAALHSIQACIPHKTILPVGVDHIVVGSEWTLGASIVHAVERSNNGDNFIYGLRIEDAEGKLCEEWEGLHLHAVAPIQTKTSWPSALLVTYLERKLDAIFGASGTRIGLATAPEERCSCTAESLVHGIFGPGAKLTHRPDGKPIIKGAGDPAPCISLSHSTKATLLLAIDNAVAAGCDLEEITNRNSESWEHLLGVQEFALAQVLADASKFSFDNAATQIWSLKEALRKAGACLDQSSTFSSCSPCGWGIFSAGEFRAATFQTCVEEAPAPFAFAFVIRAHHASV